MGIMENELMVPPSNIQAEMSLLGCLLRSNQAFDHIYDIKPDAFYKTTNGKIYKAISELISNNEPADVLTVAEKLDSDGHLDAVGGIAYLGELPSSQGVDANIKQYADSVRDKYMLRQLILALNELTQDAYSPGEVDKKLDRAQSRIMAITERTQTNDPKFIRDLLPERVERIDRLYMGEEKSIGTGLVDLDEKLGGGFLGGQLIIVAGRPAMGKSALAVQLARHIQTGGEAGLIFSCEMSNGEIVDRLIASQAKIDSQKMRTGQFQDEDFDRLTASIGALQNVNLLVDDTSFTINAITAKARSVKRKYGLSVIVIDYLQLLEADGDTRERQIANISRNLKILAKELNVPVIALSQLNRKVDERKPPRPFMSDIRESGAVEQDADVIIFVYREEEYYPDTPNKGIAELIIGKQRAGSTGTVRTTFIGSQTKFENYTGGYQEYSEQPKFKAPKGFNYE